MNCGLSPEHSAQAIRDVGIGFLFAPMLHPAMKYAQPARLELKMRTVFNLLGPLTNPAGASTQLIGAASPEAAELIAKALTGLAPQRAFVVHGDGLDEGAGKTEIYRKLAGTAGCQRGDGLAAVPDRRI